MQVSNKPKGFPPWQEVTGKKTNFKSMSPILVSYLIWKTKKEKRGLKYRKYLTGCGSVGRAVDSDTTDPQFESIKMQVLFTINCTKNCIEKTKITKKWGRDWPKFLKIKRAFPDFKFPTISRSFQLLRKEWIDSGKERLPRNGGTRGAKQEHLRRPKVVTSGCKTKPIQSRSQTILFFFIGSETEAI